MATEEAVNEEKILVSVRVRPLNDKEKAKNDVSDWECFNNTVMYNSNQPDRASSPSAYSFDRVFGFDSSTKHVYEEAAKEVALSVVNGINSTIFAYGQTSSGKTYTMNGVTEFAVTDIYDHMGGQSDREFVLKFSAMEIYNEAVRDLLSSENVQLRLLDDPEKGTVVEKLSEEVLRDRNHLEELLSLCAAQRKIGETSLNETSSRSHQILRLTIESTSKQLEGLQSSGTLAATVNFVDLAGSERVAQALSAGARLKEGCHINRSLLTLGTVIRKLSTGRNGHIPYRDSKLTRILQNSLGGNARTAIICTMSPARSHVEQSKNTLFFASCAKEVTTNAKVNVVRSDKALVKQLQQQLAKMENALKSLATNSMKEKELLLQQMDKEIKELTKQRDFAQSRVQNLLQSVEEGQARIVENSGLESSDKGVKACTPLDSTDRPSCSSNSSKHFQRISEISEENFLLDGSAPKFEAWEDIAERSQAEDKDIAQSSHAEPEDNARRSHVKAQDIALCNDTAQEHLTEPEDVCKEIRCIDQMEEPSMDKSKIFVDEEAGSSSQQKEDAELRNASEEYEALQRKIHDLQMTINTLVTLNGPLDQSPCSTESSPVSLSFSRSRSARAVLLSSLSPGKETVQNEPATPTFKSKHGINIERLHKEDVQAPVVRATTNTDETREPEAEEDLPDKTQEVSQHKVSRPKHGMLTQKDSVVRAITNTDETRKPEVEDLPDKRQEVSQRKVSKLKHRKLTRRDSGRESLLSVQVEAEDREPDEEDVVEELPRGSKGLRWMLFKSKQPGSKSVMSSSVMSSKSASVLSAPVAWKVIQNYSESDLEDNVSVLNFDEEHKKDRYEKHGRSSRRPGSLDTSVQRALRNNSDWRSEFERQRGLIIELWDACYVPLVHRSHFFLLYKGDPSDFLYLEVELRRMTALKETFSDGSNRSTVSDRQALTPASSMKALKKEREMLSKKVHKRFPRKDRERLYQKWGIRLNTKERSLQLTNYLWTSTMDMRHIRESAALVAKLIDLAEPLQAPKEILGLSFLSRPVPKKSSFWDSMSTL
ncbi:putative plus-end-directed kinesin ATPase [Rosa chinensis]|uniref:Putative plus-end-directed kinesin ATPase n=1 Tax=Rosa chinensis TaxID=74649 RepID=A0A2P6PYZ4_ROSCH|nr:kinesin-like protein KIN-7E [Rosa chinensis]PRQ27143.1 putative plus-end-directed kinesin ATPase [Rosa chinensis]